MNDEAQAILQFWFGRASESPDQAEQQSALWWNSTPAQDAEITERYLGLHEQAAAGQLSAWENDPYGRLALILLLDQFPRNMFRKTARAFATDARALELTQFGVRKAVDAELDPPERIFFYLPMEHAENSAMQKMCLLMLGSLRNEVLPEWKPYVQQAYDFALQHQRIIQQFGRFPHRNAVLGRQSTPDEIAWLESSGLNWGQ
jgi:uncharacterized protein (DUF924 family)